MTAVESTPSSQAFEPTADAAPVTSPAVTPAPATASGVKLPVRVAAELVGSFLVCFAVYAIGTYGTVIQGVNLAFVALGTGLAYAAAALMLGKVSGGQVNPAVTVAEMLLGRTKVLDGILCIVAQVVGALGAAALIVWMLPSSEQVPASQWLTPAVNGYGKGSVSYSVISAAGLDFGIAMAIIVEVVAGIVVIGAAVATEGTARVAATGVAYGVAAAIAFPVTGAALNPARATGIAVFAQGKELAQAPLQQLWVFWLAPVLAAALVALAVIVAQMVDEPTPAKAVTDAVADQDGAEGEPEATDGEVAEPADASVQETAAEVREEQSDAQTDADHGVERH
ncbi:aquaporin [Bifidobacterium pullorum subsp. saeculare]|uniref:Aquaporin n=1 Tax=Bifidobacterium pullorum subsp. saeculare TaxID=78257 RepID=A0A939B9A4_9BIFI|nr:aquaporin [Bifidobacterium pullorum]MBM6699304.1 aquaporin [Bifidobacterium pullorum subsp. saeculare]